MLPATCSASWLHVSSSGQLKGKFYDWPSCYAIDAIVRHDRSKGRHVPVQLLSLLCYLEFLSFLLCMKRQRVGHPGQTARSLVSGFIAEPLTYLGH